MAQSSVSLNARRSQRLLKRQQYRERHAQAVLNGLQSNQATALYSLDQARQDYRTTQQDAVEMMRHRWDDSANTLLSIDQLRDLRDHERDKDADLRAVERRIASVEQILAEYPAQIESASAALARESALTMKRQRITTYCNRKLAAIITHREERALEDDLIGRQSAAR